MTPELLADLNELIEILDHIPVIVAHQKDHDTGANVGDPVRTILAQVPETLMQRIRAHLRIETQIGTCAGVETRCDGPITAGDPT